MPQNEMIASASHQGVILDYTAVLLRLGERERIQDLLAALTDSEEAVRNRAVGLLGDSGDMRAIGPLMQIGDSAAANERVLDEALAKCSIS